MARKDFKKNTAELFISAAENEPGADPSGQEALTIPKGYRLVKENKSDRLQLLIRPTIKEALKHEATAQGLSMNDLINSIIEEYLKGRGTI